jgi:hypothetical protein
VTIARTTGDIAICQTNETLPAGVSAVRLSMRAFYGARVHLIAYSGSRALTEGRRAPDWTGQSVTVPVKAVDRTISPVRLCFSLGPNSEPVAILGALTPAREAAVAFKSNGISTPGAAAGAGLALEGKVGVEYLAPGRGSWWSRIPSVAVHMGLGRAFGGTWIVFLAAALTAAVGVLAVRLALRELP